MNVLQTQMDRFLAGVERQAWSMANIAVKDSDDALDIVQDTMMTLVRKYAHKPTEQWRPLFFRILQNRIRDFHRRRKTYNRLFSLFSAFRTESEQPVDPASLHPGRESDQPEERTMLDDSREALVDALRRLPLRQQQVFVLRAAEGMSVAEAAAAMGVSEGSVKTHYSRAVQKLRQLIEEHVP